ncbi:MULTISPECIES: DJ-1/PfpI family protein [Bradyrhizobium]|uniref:DJ-1/PfpI family protein n=1 Tax=Bradyrhizobium frederickii TaxID=2560054 RepID=A0A4Y9KVB4_9BRAD|nr:MULTISPECIES: DJ-1/PfpI family protein [Bradyrhizobium]RTE88361.1 DJ-1/PfpI family protein [Bradyrhizobium sp. LVM 105]TFV30451.1 DJ-1/PfpI family protein [Bradyrhizobium frederickii]TFV68900.1 DJ-1/PfpI family protein [Bradyrhizobium frederickii]
MAEDIESKLNVSASADLSRRALMLGGLAGAAAVLGGLPLPAAIAAEAIDAGSPFHILFVLYEKFTLQDFAGANEVLARLPHVRVSIASPQGGTIISDTHVSIGGSQKLADVQGCDLICVPGGTDRSTMMTPDVQQDLRRLSDGAKYVTSICNGSLILGAAGLLKGRRSACHWAQRNLLPQYGAIPDPARVVIDGRYMSGGGVTAGIDFALTVAAMLRGPVQAQVVQLLMEYEPDPPFHSGRPESAPPEVLEAFKTQYAALAKIAGLVKG